MRVNQAFPARFTAPTPAPDGDGPAPCHHGDCPFCPCPCCYSQVYAAMGILPQETARAAYAPPLSAIAAPPALLGSLAGLRFLPGSPARLQS